MSDAIFRALATRYALPEWVLVPQVRDGTGFSASRTADAVAMNCYPSKGLEIHGFEFKVARGDWLRELRDGSKAEAVAQHCDRWWIVATEGVVIRDELPKAWGLVLCKDDALRTVVAAPPLPRTVEMGPIDRSFIASFLRGCLERSKKPSDADLAAARRAGELEERTAWKKREQRQASDAAALEGRWSDAVRKFEAASGVQIDSWDGGQVGEEFRVFIDLRRGHKFDSLARTSCRLREIANSLDALAPDVPLGREE